jgi:hypothetical protein
MDVATETLFAGEAPASADFKLVRLARQFRSVAMTNLDAHVMIVGSVSQKSLKTSDVDGVISRMIKWAADVRDELISFGVFDNAIVGFLPLQPAPTTDDILVVTARDTPRTNPFPGMRVIPASEAASASDDDGPVKGQVLIDPFAKANAVRPGRNLDTQIEVTVWDDKGNGKKLPGTLKVTLNVTPNAIEEVGAELTLFNQKLKSQMFWGAITKLEFSVKLSGKLDFDQSTATRLVGQWSGQLKSSVEFDLKVPKTSIGVHVEGALTLDQAGKVAPGLQLSWDF